jgi:hypothetical protein
MAEVDIGAETFTTYADVDTADAYLTGSIHAGTDWSGATTDNKGRALVTATRILDRQRWLAAYDTFAERSVVQNIIDASIEMALALVQGSGLQTDQSTAQQLQSIKAGSVSLTYFRGAEGVPLRFPLIVWELLRDYLVGTGTGTALLPKATGVDGQSVTAQTFGFTGGI